MFFLGILFLEEKIYPLYYQNMQMKGHQTKKMLMLIKIKTTLHPHFPFKAPKKKGIAEQILCKDMNSNKVDTLNNIELKFLKNIIKKKISKDSCLKRFWK